MTKNTSKLLGAGNLRNYSVRDARGKYVAVMQCASMESAMARVPKIAAVIEGGIATPVTLARHEGTVHWPWFSESWFQDSAP